MADAGLMGGIGSLAEGFLRGREMRKNQQAQDLEQQKYETYKQQLGETNAQKQRELSIQALGVATHGVGEAGGPVEEAIAQRMGNIYGPQGPSGQSPQDSEAPPEPADSTAPAGSGFMNYKPGVGMLGVDTSMPPSPYSTVPSVTAQVNPGSPVPPSLKQMTAQNPILSAQPLIVRQAQMAQLKDANDKVNAVLERGGQAKVVYDENGTPRPQVIGLGPQASEEINNLKHGQRSAEGSINSQYNEDLPIKVAKGSQINMAQMMDNYKNPSPQGDASLVLNAFKIKFPNQATDVNSIEELQHSQAVPDSWKAQASKAINGQFDQATRDNLMRDGISTYRANVGSMLQEQKKFSSRSKNANVNGSLIMDEPAVMGTYKQAQELQDQIGPYQPPSQRGGFMNSVAGLLGRMSGVAAPNQAAQQDPQISKYAKQYGLDYGHAEQILRARGYGRK